MTTRTANRLALLDAESAARVWAEAALQFASEADAYEEGFSDSTIVSCVENALDCLVGLRRREMFTDSPGI